MSRPIRRGYPYPPHGRHICYHGYSSLAAYEMVLIWQGLIDSYLGMADTIARVLQPILDTVSKTFDDLAAWYDSLPPEFKAAIADAARAQEVMNEGLR